MNLINWCLICCVALCLLSGCKEEVPGCTDVESLSYVAEATEDDGSCVYERDQFFGNYRGQVNCSDGSGSSVYPIGIGPQGSQKDEVVIDLQCCPQLNFTGKVTDNSISVNTEVMVQFIYCGTPIRSTRMSGNFVLNGTELSVNNVRLQYFDALGNMACSITCGGVVSKQ